MPEYSDIYVISDKRSIESITGYLDHFLPNRKESADEYEYPQYSDNPELVSTQVKEILKLCERNKDADYSIFWQSIDGAKPEHGMVYFLNDGYVIYGLSTDAADEAYTKSLLEKLKIYLGSSHGYMTWEAAPDATTYDEFLAAEKVNENI